VIQNSINSANIIVVSFSLIHFHLKKMYHIDLLVGNQKVYLEIEMMLFSQYQELN
jgi:hypothetical protein